MPDEWVVYGARSHPTRPPTTAGVHAKFNSEDEAVAWLMSVILKYGHGHVKAVVVRLKAGDDRNGFHEIVRRVNDGKGWWE